MNYESYSHPAWLDELTEQLRNDVLRFINTGELSDKLNIAIQRSEELRQLIDTMTERELDEAENSNR